MLTGLCMLSIHRGACFWTFSGQRAGVCVTYGRRSIITLERDWLRSKGGRRGWGERRWGGGAARGSGAMCSHALRPNIHITACTKSNYYMSSLPQSAIEKRRKFFHGAQKYGAGAVISFIYTRSLFKRARWLLGARNHARACFFNA